ncbi:MAG: glycosyltransferase family A protein [Mucilaginibacter sp.]|uniref:glycosyltransferase family 2 protein n=1 Tax=Mucilaginibacter sp. TaxID=1882438 RepID=UPI0031B33D99
MSYKFSFCTVSMNRLHHLKETFIRNIEDNVDYDNIEHILLDYNSSDGMEKWVKDHCATYIEDKKVVYYRTAAPQNFHRSHSKNMLLRLAEGDVVCFIDADNFTGKGYANYINTILKNNQDAFVSTIGKRVTNNATDVLGRACCKRSDLLKIEGYDESMADYGMEDVDLANRLEILGKKRILLKKPEYLNAISHFNDERTVYQSNNLQFRLYVHYINPSVSELLYMYDNNTFSVGMVTDNATLHSGKKLNLFKNLSCELMDRNWVNGNWRLSDNTICLTDEVSGKSMGNLTYEDSVLKVININDKCFYLITNPEVASRAQHSFSILRNRYKTRQNQLQKIIATNDGNFGRGKVFKNFDYTHPTIL